MSTTPGTCIGPYRILSSLGRGGMGEVFSAVHERTEQVVALKLLTQLEPASSARFIQEARALSQLDHPGVVRLLFLGQTDDGVPYLVMEQVVGCSLRTLLQEHPRGLPYERALALVARTATIMTTVHGCGIFHRDLKPDNILLPVRSVDSQAGDVVDAVEAVKIIDFGIARVPPPQQLGTDTLVDTAAQGPLWLGTPVYMAPEQCRRGLTLGPAADVYALGVVLYELLCGHPPFQAEDRVELAAQHLYQAPDLKSVAPGPLRLLLGRMLAKEPALRPTMAEVATVLSGSVGPARNRRLLLAYLLGSAGASSLLLIGLGAKRWPQLSRDSFSSSKKRAGRAIAGAENGISSGQMLPSCLIALTHMEWGTAPAEPELRGCFPESYQKLPLLSVAAPVTGAAESGNFAAAKVVLTTWFEQTVQPLLAKHPGYRVVYFGVAPIPLTVYLGWLLRSLPAVEVRLRHHEQKRFLPWRHRSDSARLLPARWSHERSGQPGDVVVRLSTSYTVNHAAVRAAVPSALCDIELTLERPAPDAFCCAEELLHVAKCWHELLTQIPERFPQVQRVHLFASVQAGVALLLGTYLSRAMHPPLLTYQYQNGTFVPSLVVNPAITKPI